MKMEITYLQAFSAVGGRCFKTQFKKLQPLQFGIYESMCVELSLGRTGQPPHPLLGLPF